MSTGEVIKSSQSPVIYQIEDNFLLYYIAIAIIDQDNYVGPISDPLIISNKMKRGRFIEICKSCNSFIIFIGSSDVVIPVGSSLVGIVIFIVLLIVGLTFTLFVYVVKHRRLQNNFISFANTHYINNSGSASYTADGLGMSHLLSFYY